MEARTASAADAEPIAAIYNQGIEDGTATFETVPRSAADVRAWFDGRHPIVVVEAESVILAFGATFRYRPRECYSGIAEASIYVARGARGRGAGRAALEALIAAAESAGYWKLLSRIFVDNGASRALVRSCGFREVGTYEKHGWLAGVWRDVVIVERLIDSNLASRGSRGA